MGANETGTSGGPEGALQGTWVDSRIAEHEGRIVKLTGDGMLVEFSNAVACATEIQRKMRERNAGVPSPQGTNRYPKYPNTASIEALIFSIVKGLESTLLAPSWAAF